MDTSTIIIVVLMLVALAYDYAQIIWTYWSTRKINNECIVFIGVKPLAGCKVVKMPEEETRNVFAVRTINWDSLVRKQIGKYNPRTYRPLFIEVTKNDFYSAMKQLIWLDYSPGPIPSHFHNEPSGPIVIRGLFQKTHEGGCGIIGSTEEYNTNTKLPKRPRLRPETIVLGLVFLALIFLNAPGYLAVIAYLLHSVYFSVKDKK